VAHWRTELSRLLRQQESAAQHLWAWRQATRASAHRRRRLREVCWQRLRAELDESRHAFRALAAALLRSRGVSPSALTWRMCLASRKQNLKHRAEHGGPPKLMDTDMFRLAATGADWVTRSLALCVSAELRARTFGLWRRHVDDVRRRRDEAGRRMRAFARPMLRWTSETAALCFVMWKRLAGLKAAWRRGAPPPAYPSHPVAAWDAFEAWAIGRRERKRQGGRTFRFGLPAPHLAGLVRDQGWLPPRNLDVGVGAAPAAQGLRHARP